MNHYSEDRAAENILNTLVYYSVDIILLGEEFLLEKLRGLLKAAKEIFDASKHENAQPLEKFLDANTFLINGDYSRIDTITTIFYLLLRERAKIEQHLPELQDIYNASDVSPKTKLDNVSIAYFAIRHNLESIPRNIRKKSKQLREKAVDFFSGTEIPETESIDESLVFISHAGKDKPIANEIAKRLEASGISTWLDEKDIKPGESIPERIIEGLRAASHVLLIYSQNSKNRPWVKTEVDNAVMFREQNEKPKIIPILLDGLDPPPILSNIKGIKFENSENGYRSILDIFGAIDTSKFKFEESIKFLKVIEKGIRISQRCARACKQGNPAYGVSETTFQELLEIEEYVNGHIDRKYPIQSLIESNGVAFRKNSTVPHFDDHFYSNSRCYIMVSIFLRELTEYGQGCIFPTL